MRPAVSRLIPRAAALLSVLLAAGGCRTPAPWTPVDLSEPGWQARESLVVWTPRPGAVPVVGELMTASHADGRRWIQFSKQGLPLVNARVEPGAWRIDAPAFRRSHLGRGQPPASIPWFQIRELPPKGPVAAPWSLDEDGRGAWRLHRAGKGGEQLEGTGQ